jgi:hypothetical protein
MKRKIEIFFSRGWCYHQPLVFPFAPMSPFPDNYFQANVSQCGRCVDRMTEVTIFLRINICGENCHLRQARKRYLQANLTTNKTVSMRFITKNIMQKANFYIEHISQFENEILKLFR